MFSFSFGIVASLKIPAQIEVNPKFEQRSKNVIFAFVVVRRYRQPLMPKGTEKRELRRQALIEEAITVLARHGVEATTLDRVGKKFKMKRSLVAYYFKNREELLISAARFVTQTAQGITIQKVTGAKNWEQRLRAIIEGALEWYENYPDQVTVFLLFYYYCSYNPKLKKSQSEIRAQGAERLATVIAMSPSALPKAKALHTARLIQALITGEIIDKAVTHSSFLFKESAQALYDASLALIADAGRDR